MYMYGYIIYKHFVRLHIGTDWSLCLSLHHIGGHIATQSNT